ncbi:trans-2-enoyl-CoA reductase family protein [Clostridium sp. D2Q-11]|uniref:Trans-2-enoyl-CoA reductase [NADH] n=1 Tax=Anaeromonas frigoriresistens TaxID=2683708 RepID=A0A942Z916_9FIRM|nr:enoyl-ACP reductase FabV [Anaeromonas frigoriresistens]MBS4538614.1 trans-2-enoyl-CoA reductase family protein [Anaeromonas frigoriresistens]
MIIKPELKGNVSKTAHPYGCREVVKNQIRYVKDKGRFEGPKKVLILGASSSYGLASRIALAFGAGADTIGLSYERGIVNEEKLATAGWWNNIFFKEEAENEGLIAKNFIGDAFSDDMKERVIEYIKKEFGGKIDLLIYSLASGRRTDPRSGNTYYSALKPIGESIKGYNINIEKEELFEQEVVSATKEEIDNTVKVMGGEDWRWWVEALLKEDLLAERFKTTLFSYIGPEVTEGFYRSGTLGRAKKDAEETSDKLNNLLRERVNGESIITVSKAATTKASAVIPILPVYACSLYKVMNEKGLHETLIMHQYRLFNDMIYGDKREIDGEGRLRPDSWEMREDVQSEVKDILKDVTPENFKDTTAFDVFMKEFMELNGFGIDNVNYEEDINIEELKKFKP